MKTPKTETRSIYRITHRERGTVHHVAAESAQEACDSLGWLPGDCHVFKLEPSWHKNPDDPAAFQIKIPCHVCQYQFAECKKPEPLICPARSDVPDLTAWLDSVMKAHLCQYYGIPLKHTDHRLHQKWVPLPDAIKELTPSP